MFIAKYWFLGVIVLGFLLKKLRLLDKELGVKLMKLVFSTTLPALILIAIPSIQINKELIFVPLIMMFFIFGVFVFAYPITKSLKLVRKTEGALLLSCIIMNTGFFYPFVEAFFGDTGVVLLSLFDVANAIVMFSFIYFMASTYNEVVSLKQVLKKVFLSPPLLSILLGFMMLFLGLHLPSPIFSFLQIAAKGNTPLLMLAVGLLLELNFPHKLYLLYTIFLRMVFGLALGLIAVEMLHFTGLMRTITLMLAVAPSGFNTVMFSTLEDLDKEYAVGVLTVTLLISMVITPIILAHL